MLSRVFLPLQNLSEKFYITFKSVVLWSYPNKNRAEIFVVNGNKRPFVNLGIGTPALELELEMELNWNWCYKRHYFWFHKAYGP